MFKANVKRKKSTTNPKKVTSEQYLSAELPRVLNKFVGKRYTLASASKMVREIQQVIVSATCIKPTKESRLRELQEQLHGKAFIVKDERAAGYFMVENVGMAENIAEEALRIEGLFARLGKDGKISDVCPVELKHPLSSTCVRDGKLRTHIDGHDYRTYAILSDEDYGNVKQCAKFALCRISRRLDNL